MIKNITDAVYYIGLVYTKHVFGHYSVELFSPCFYYGPVVSSAHGLLHVKIGGPPVLALFTPYYYAGVTRPLDGP